VCKERLAGQWMPVPVFQKYIKIPREARKVNPKTQKRREKKGDFDGMKRFRRRKQRENIKNRKKSKKTRKSV